MAKEWMHDDGKRLNCLNASNVYKDFCRKFGQIITEVPSGKFSYSSENDACYYFPNELKDEQVLEAMEKSVKEDHNYLLDLIAKPENEPPKHDIDVIY